MNDEQQRIAIAEACGWHRNEQDIWVGPNGGWFGKKDWAALSDYLNDLNVMHEAEKLLTIEQQTIYLQLLSRQMFFVCHATARQRAEAFLKTLNLWKD